MSRPLRIAAAAITVAGLLALFGRSLAGYAPRFGEVVAGFGAWAPLAFIAAYVVAAVAFVPGSLLSLAAGAIFGVVRGTLYVLLGATLGATAAFLVARYFVRGHVERRVRRHPRFAAIDDAVAANGRTVVFLLRLSPVLPFNLLNYALGVTRVRLADFVAGCAGMLPGIVLYVYSGSLAGSVARAVGGLAAPRGAGYYAALALGLVATVAVTVLVTRGARRALRVASPGGLAAEA